MRRMRLILLTLVIGAATGALAIAAGLIHAQGYYAEPGPLRQDAVVIVPRGAHISAIAAALRDRGVIRNSSAFIAIAAWEGQLHKLKAGEYAFPAEIPIARVLAMMAKGDVVQHRLTFPEGLTSLQVAQLIDADPALAGPPVDVPAEGTLLPDTYIFLRGDARSGLVERMRAAMTRTLDRLWPSRAANPAIATPQQAVVLASIVEKETGLPAERPRIAGVFLNRLARGMKLQSDPTAIYALTRGHIQTGGEGPLGRRLTLADLQIDSPYNTYRTAGLPPAPIANPGLGSLQAVLHPETNGLLYFVANGTGGHAFAATLPEQNANVAAWRTIRRAGAPDHP